MIVLKMKLVSWVFLLAEIWFIGRCLFIIISNNIFNVQLQSIGLMSRVSTNGPGD